VKWNAEAAAQRRPRLVFCASMADVFEDHPDLPEQRERLWALIDETPWLIWQLLTKRPENIAAMVPWSAAPRNVWLGTSIENSRFTFRVGQLTEVPAPVHFLSCEPLLGSLFESRGNRRPLALDDVEWVIGGGESGPRHRLVDPVHARELRDVCVEAGVPFFWKQNGGRWPKVNGKLLDDVEWCEIPTPARPAPPRAELSLF
jgi:protein gp37